LSGPQSALGKRRIKFHNRPVQTGDGNPVDLLGPFTPFSRAIQFTCAKLSARSRLEAKNQMAPVSRRRTHSGWSELDDLDDGTLSAMVKARRIRTI